MGRCCKIREGQGETRFQSRASLCDVGLELGLQVVGLELGFVVGLNVGPELGVEVVGFDDVGFDVDFELGLFKSLA